VSIFKREKSPPVTVQVQANLTWQVAHDVRAEMYVGFCEPLNLNAIGETWVEFQQCANEAIMLLFLDLFRSGELEQFLRNNGWRASTTLPPRGVEPQFDVPYDVHRTDVEELIAARA
jgi:hypothetical protein